MHHHRHTIYVLLLCLIAAGYVNPARAASPQPQFFPETGHTLADPMQSYWAANGGLPVFGYPLSEAFRERRVDAPDGFWTQYFERNRLEAHPENKAPYHVLLGRLGVEALEKQGRNWQAFTKAKADAPHFFAPTGHAVAHAPFWSYWSTHGLELDGRAGISAAESLALWGYPVSEPAMETNASGDRVLTQWFERARFEDHGSKGVLLGLLSSELTVGRKAEPPFRRIEGPGTPARTDVGGKILFARAGDTWVYRPRTGELRKLLDRAAEARWSSDGRSVAFVRADGLYVAGADGANIRLIYAGGDVHAPVWSPDGAKLAFLRGVLHYETDRAVDERVVWSVELQSRVAHKLAAGFDPAWSPDSSSIAYVTVVRGAGLIESGAGNYNPGRNELHVVSWRGQADRAIVREVPANTPTIDNLKRSELGHALQTPFWDPAGKAIYVFAALVGVPDATLYGLEQADADKGGSTFLRQFDNISNVVPSPERRAFLVGLAGLGGGPWFEARAVTGDDAAWTWANTQQDPFEKEFFGGAVWAPDSRAVAHVICEPAYSETSIGDFCSLAIRTPRGSSVIVRSIEGGLDWGRDE